MKLEHLFIRQNFFFLSWLLIIISINTSYDDLIKSIYILDFTRALLGIVGQLLILFFFIKEIYLKKKLYFSDLTLSLFLTYLFFQSFGLIFTSNHIYNFYWILISTFSILLFSLNRKKIFMNYVKYYLILIISLIIIFLIYYPSYIYNFFKSTDISMYAYWPEGYHIKIFTENFSPRSSGFGRTAALIGFVFLLLHLYKTKFFKINFVIYCFFSSVVIMTFSRTNILAYITAISIISFINSENIKQKFSNFFLYIVIPIFLVLAIILIKYFVLSYSDPKFSYFPIDNTENKILLRKDFQTDAKIDINKISSGRLKDWINITTKTYEESPIYGFGAQGDRFLINQTSSSAFIYAFSSSGIIGLVFFCILYLRSLLISFRLLIRKDNYLTFTIKNYFTILASLNLIFLLIRSFFESSIAVFGIDFLVFILCLGITELIYKKKYA